MLGEPIGNNSELPFPNADILDLAYDMSSGGMGIHLHAVEQFQSGEDSEGWIFDSVSGIRSNYLANPYVLGWLGNKDLKKHGPVISTPLATDHLWLGKHAEKLYANLNARVMRIALGGMQAHEAAGGKGQIKREEYNMLLLSAQSAGLLTLGEGSPDQIPLNLREFSFSSNFNFVHGARLFNDFIPVYEAAQRNSIFQLQILEAATYKLGFMLAITDQITFEAASLGTPVHYQQGPTENIERIAKYWQEYFGEEMPGIGALYEQAHGVLTKVAPPDDPYLAHILAMSTLPQLTRE